jgi:3-mercaptopyruvate sulfurtransferase SseA
MKQLEKQARLVVRVQKNVYAPMPSATQFASVMSQIGIVEGTRAVLYDD